MQKVLSVSELKELAAQLAHPRGANGIKTAEKMQLNNRGMTEAAIKALELKEHEQVLEIGPGNAAHVSFLLQQQPGIRYSGAEISSTLIREATKINHQFLAKGQAGFQLSTPNALPYKDAAFDKIFSVNTLYFWANPIRFMQEITRVLKPGGKLVLCFADKNFMEKLPFTAYGFNLYHQSEIEHWFRQTGFKRVGTARFTEETSSQAGFPVNRLYYVLSGNKKSGK